MDTQIIVNFQSIFDGEDWVNEKDWDNEDDFIIYIDIENPDEYIEHQQYPDEIVIPMEKIKIEYTFPLSNTKIFEYQTKNEAGFTRAELVKKVCKGYQKIYESEEMSLNDPAVGDKDNCPYGTWGYGIEDLVLYEVRQIEGNLFELEVDSKNNL